MTNTYHIGGNWGDAINWEPVTQFEKPGTYFKVIGWKQKIPQVGDFLLDQFRKGTAKFQFTEVDRQRDPADMFFATVSFMGYVEAEA